MRRQVSIIATTILFIGSLLGAFYEPVTTLIAFLSHHTATLISASTEYFLADGEILDQIRRGSLGVITVLSLYALTIKILHYNQPLTVLATRLRFKFITKNGDKVKIERTQVYRANERQVTAHYLVLHATNGGRIRPIKPKNSYRLPKHKNDKFNCWGTESNGWFCIQTFDPALPYSIWARMLVPNWLLILLLKFHIVTIDRPGPFLRYFASVRRLISFEDNEYTIEKPYVEVSAVRYVTSNIWLEFYFQNYSIKNIEAHRLASNGLIDITIHGPDQKDKYHSITISKLSDEIAQIRWRNPNPI